MSTTRPFDCESIEDRPGAYALDGVGPDEADLTTSHRWRRPPCDHLGSLTRRHIRIALGLLWIIDAALQAQPHFFGFDWWHDDVAQSVMGQPEPISTSILWATGHLAHHAVAANALVIAVQAAIGLALALGRFERAAIIASLAWALCVWWIGEGFGGLLTGFALLPGGAPGPVLLYPLVGFLAWPKPSPDEPAGEQPAGEQPAGEQPAGEQPVGEQPLRSGAAAVAWFAIWAGGGLLELPWRFPAAQALQANIEEHSLGQPHWLSDLAHGAYRAVGSHPVLIPALVILAQFIIGAGVLIAPARRYAIGAGAVAAMVFWVVVEGLGSIASGDATDPGSGPLLLLFSFLVASAFATRASASRLSAPQRVSGRRPDPPPEAVVFHGSPLLRSFRALCPGGNAWRSPEYPKRSSSDASGGRGVTG